MNLLQLFYTVEIDTYMPGLTAAAVSPGHGALPHGVYTVSVTAASGTVYASDMGYRTLASDVGGVVAYPPLVEQAFAIDRRISLDPAASAAAAAWGSISLSNIDGRFNSIVAAQNSDGREVRIANGVKSWDATRGLWLDLPKSYNQPVFYGIAQPWTLNLATLDIPLRDATYWLEKPLQSNLYDGSGGYNGGADLTGKPKPKTRGGTALLPVRNVPLVLIDATNLIYQYSDGPGTVVALYEGGDTNITFQANTANLYSGATTAGKFRTDNSRGLVQLGSAAARQITADVTGQFPSAGVQTLPGSIARYLLTEDAALPSAYVDTSAFSALDGSYGYTSGIFIGPDDALDGATAAGFILNGLGAKLYPKRDGTLSVFALRPPTGTPTAQLTTANVVSCTPRDLPPVLYPPPYRLRAGYQKAYAVQTSGLAPTLSAARQSYVANQWRSAAATSAAVQAAYRRPNDPPIIEGGLLSSGDAGTVATDLLALWGTRRRLYDVTVPVFDVGLNLDLGNIVALTYPLDNLNSGALGIIVGDQFRSQDATITFQVLV